MSGQQPQGNSGPNGAGQGDTPNEGGEPKFVTEEQLNRAITARFSAFERKLEKSTADLVSSISGKLEELVASKLEAVMPKGGDASGDASKGKKEADPKVDISEHPIVKALQREINELKSASEKLREERDAEKAKARNQILRTRVAEELAKAGVDQRHLNRVVTLLVDAEKVVRFEDDNSEEIVFVDKAGDVDLATGIQAWIANEDNKIFLPPRGTRGSGDNAGKTPLKRGADPTAQLREQAAQGLAAVIAGLTG